MNIKLGKILGIIMGLSMFTAHADMISRKQARNYIENAVDTLFLPNQHTQKTVKQLDNFKELATENILGRVSSYEQEYNTYRIYKQLLKRVINFIERKSLQYSQNQLDHLGVTYNQDIVMAKVASKIRAEVQNIVYKSNAVQSGALSKYVGSALINKVNSYVLDELDSLDDSYSYEVRPVVRHVYPVVRRVYCRPVCPVYRTHYCCAPRAHFGFNLNFNI